MAYPFSTLVGALSYIVMGLGIGLSNIAIGFAILKYSALRQHNQYILLMALAFADGCLLMGFAFTGFSRLWLVVTESMELVTPLECFFKPQSILWLLSTGFAPLMLVLISVDRLFLVAFPETYLLSLPSPKYGYCLVGSGFAATSLMALLGTYLVFTKDQTPTEHPFCFNPDFHSIEDSTLSYIYEFYYESGTPLLALLSVLIFLAVPIVQKFRADPAITKREQQERLTSQKKMTQSLAISSACTLFLFIIPTRLGFMAGDEGWVFLGRCLFLLSLTNPLANIFIYQLRHPELRKALLGLLRCKHMPDNLRLWHTTQHQPSQPGEGKTGHPGVEKEEDLYVEEA